MLSRKNRSLSQGLQNSILTFGVIGTMLVLILGFNSCTQSQANPIPEAVILTNLPHLHFAAQQYNLTNPGVRVRVRRSNDLREDLEDTTSQIDAVIARNFAYPQVHPLLSDLTSLMDDLGRNPQFLPPGSVVFSSQDRSPVAMAIAYDLPVVVFPTSPATTPVFSEGTPRLLSWTMEIAELTTRARPLNRLTQGRFDRIGFDPLWDEHFLIPMLRLFQTNLSADPMSETRVGWDSKAMETAFDFLKSWHGDTRPTRGDIQAFNRGFGYDPWYILLLNGRVGYRVTTLSEFLSLPDQFRSRLQIRWLMGEQEIQIYDMPIMLSIPRTSTSTLGISRFISWLLSDEGISSVLSAWVSSGEPGLSYLGGIPFVSRDPSIPLDQDHWINTYYWPLELPGTDLLTFPMTAPAQWDRIINEVLLPWFESELDSDRTWQEAEIRLQRQLEAWQRLHRAE